MAAQSSRYFSAGLAGLVVNVNLKNGVAAASCWLLSSQFSPLDLLYAILIGLAYRDFGLLSTELFMAVAILFLSHLIFRKATASIRLTYLIAKVEAFCKVNSIK